MLAKPEITEELAAAAEQYVAARAELGRIEPLVAEQQRSVLADNYFVQEDTRANQLRGTVGERILDPQAAYRMGDADFERYVDLIHVRFTAALGLDVEHGKDPIGIAANKVSAAQLALVNAAEYIFGLRYPEGFETGRKLSQYCDLIAKLVEFFR